MEEVQVKTYQEKPQYSGQLVACPNCGRTLLEAEFKTALKRCPKCKLWVLATKEKD